MGVLDASPREQLRRIVGDCAFATGATYAEVCVAPDDVISIVSPVAAQLPEAEALATAAGDVSAPGVVSAVTNFRFAVHPIARALDLHSMLLWPLQARGQNVLLVLGWTALRSAEITEEEMTFMTFLSAVVSRLLEAHEKQRSLSERIDNDSLTGLRNRAALMDHLSQALSGAQRSGTEVALLYIDLDRFKAVNDTHGHMLGDAALVEIGRRMLSILRKHEIAGRIGGDEFAIIVSPLAGRAEVDALASRLLRTICAPMIIKGVTLNMSASIGVGIFPHDAHSAQDLIAFADSAMYAAKRSGVSVLPAASNAHKDEREVIVDPLLFDSQYILCVQPIVDARSRRTIGGEILARWLHPNQGLFQPHTVLSGARRKVAMDLDRRTLQVALRKMSAITQEFGRIQFFVNIDEADNQIFEVSTANNGISLELRESSVAEDPDRFITFIKACRAAGFNVGLSRFGAGDLTLRTLARLELDFVKINAQRLRSAGIDLRTTRAIRTIMEQAHGVAPMVIAESVESQGEEEIFMSAGVDGLQGFSICSPLTEHDFIDWLRYKAG